MARAQIKATRTGELLVLEMSAAWVDVGAWMLRQIQGICLCYQWRPFKVRKQIHEVKKALRLLQMLVVVLLWRQALGSSREANGAVQHPSRGDLMAFAARQRPSHHDQI